MRDFHTHNGNISEFRALVSGKTIPELQPGSLEMHPWYLPEDFDLDVESFSSSLEKFAALGEVGLDKLRGPELPVQKRFLDAMLNAAAELDKPVVFHCVRCTQELFEAVKHHQVKRKMFHGFRGSPEALKSLWDAGFTVSFHRSIVGSGPLLELLKFPAGRFGFESDDDAACDVRDVVEKCIAVSGNRDLEKLSDGYFEEFLNG